MVASGSVICPSSSVATVAAVTQLSASSSLVCGRLSPRLPSTSREEAPTAAAPNAFSLTPFRVPEGRSSRGAVAPPPRNSPDTGARSGTLETHAGSVAVATIFSTSLSSGCGHLPPLSLASRREGEFAAAASSVLQSALPFALPPTPVDRRGTETVHDANSCRGVTESPHIQTAAPVEAAPPGPVRGAKRKQHPSVPAARPSKRLRQQAIHQFLSHATHVVQTSSSNSMERRPIRRTRKRKRTSLINCGVLTDIDFSMSFPRRPRPKRPKADATSGDAGNPRKRSSTKVA